MRGLQSGDGWPLEHVGAKVDDDDPDVAAQAADHRRVVGLAEPAAAVAVLRRGQNAQAVRPGGEHRVQLRRAEIRPVGGGPHVIDIHGVPAGEGGAQRAPVRVSVDEDAPVAAGFGERHRDELGRRGLTDPALGGQERQHRRLSQLRLRDTADHRVEVVRVPPRLPAPASTPAGRAARSPAGGRPPTPGRRPPAGRTPQPGQAAQQPAAPQPAVQWSTAPAGRQWRSPTTGRVT